MSAAMRLAVCLSVMATLAGCSADEVDQKMTLITNFGNPPVNEKPENEHVETDVLSNEPSEEPTPEGANPPLVSDPVPVVNEPPFECVTIWRQQTCDEGVLYQLDEQMNWILPGRTE